MYLQGCAIADFRICICSSQIPNVATLLFVYTTFLPTCFPYGQSTWNWPHTILMQSFSLVLQEKWKTITGICRTEREIPKNVSLTRIVIFELALRTAYHHIFASPRKLLDVWTMIGQWHGTTVIFLLAARHMCNGIEVLIFFRQWFVMSNQIAQSNRISIVRAFRLQWISFHLRTEWMNGSASEMYASIERWMNISPLRFSTPHQTMSENRVWKVKF